MRNVLCVDLKYSRVGSISKTRRGPGSRYCNIVIPVSKTQSLTCDNRSPVSTRVAPVRSHGADQATNDCQLALLSVTSDVSNTDRGGYCLMCSVTYKNSMTEWYSLHDCACTVITYTQTSCTHIITCATTWYYWSESITEIMDIIYASSTPVAWIYHTPVLGT
jgi:hypothetical protein